MQLLLLFVFGIWNPLIHSLHVNDGDYERPHVEPVLDFVVNGHNEGPNTIEHGHQQSHADEVQIAFSAFNKKWNFDLYVNHHMFSPTSAFRYHDETGEHTTILPDHTLYKTKKGEFPWASVNVHGDGTIHAIIGTKNDTFTIDPVSKFPDFKLTSKMGMYSHSADVVDGATRKLLQSLPVAKDDNPRAYPATLGSADTGLPTVWNKDAQNPCYARQAIEQKFAIGFAVTNEYYREPLLGNANPTTIQTHLKNLLADSNTIYTPQMGVHLYIESTDIRTGTGTGGTIPAPWNLAQLGATNGNGGCGETAGETLGKLRTWRLTEHRNDAGLWHLMTTCFPAPGTVGIAYLNAICSPNVGSGLSSSLSAARPGSRDIWKVVAHEIGHNFGGSHSFELGQGKTGGIMDYGDGLLNGKYQFNTQFRRTEMCARMARTLSLIHI